MLVAIRIIEEEIRKGLGCSDPNFADVIFRDLGFRLIFIAD